MLTDQEVLANCIKVVNNNYVGMLTTVDAQGQPYSRWMSSSLAANGIQRLYTLAGRKSRKMDHIQTNPNVCWVFSDEGHRNVVTLYGQATISTSGGLMQEVWDHLMDAARVYVMASLGNAEDIEYAVIDTHVERIEFLSPKLKIFAPRTIEPQPIQR